MAQDIIEKWGEAVARRGFVQVPNFLLQVNRFVDEDHKLSPVEMVVLLHLVASWWRTAELPFPSMRTLAERSGISERQVQRAIKALEAKLYLSKTRKKIKTVIASNVYDLAPTVKILKEIADHYGNEHPRRLKRESAAAGSDTTAGEVQAKERNLPKSRGKTLDEVVELMEAAKREGQVFEDPPANLVDY